MDGGRSSELRVAKSPTGKHMRGACIRVSSLV